MLSTDLPVSELGQSHSEIIGKPIVENVTQNEMSDNIFQNVKEKDVIAEITDNLKLNLYLQQ